MINYKILSEVRKEKGVTWGYLETLINGHRGKFVDYRNGKTALTDNEETTIANALNVSLDYLCGKSEQ